MFIKSPSSIIQLHSCLNGVEGQQQAQGLLSRAVKSRTRGSDPQSGHQRISVKQTDEYGNNRDLPVRRDSHGTRGPEACA